MDEKAGRKAGNYRKGLIGLGLCISFLLHTTPASANDWPRLPDDRVVITFKGIKIGLATDEYHLANTLFSMDRAAELKLAPDKVAPTLGDFLAKQNLAEQLLSQQKSINIMVKPPYPELNVLAQGKFDSSKLANKMGLSGYDSSVIQIGAYVDESSIKHACLSKEKKVSGFFFSSENNNQDVKEYYCLPAAKRKFVTSRDLQIECHNSAYSHTCTSHLYGKNKPIIIGYSFDLKDFPKSDWVDLDRRMRDYFQYILFSEELR